MKTPEGYEKDDLKKFLKSLGEQQCFFFSPNTHGFGASGVPDIVACIHGQFWGLEVKREGGKLTVLQGLRLKEIANAGGRVAFGTAKEIIEAIKHAYSLP